MVTKIILISWSFVLGVGTNIFRSKILRPETNKIYYLENDNATYTLLDRQTNLIYNVIWDNKVNYFLTHQDAYHYMFDIVKSQVLNVK